MFADFLLREQQKRLSLNLSFAYYVVALFPSSTWVQWTLFCRFSLFFRPQLSARIPALFTSSTAGKWTLLSRIHMCRWPRMQVVWQTIRNMSAGTCTCFSRSGICVFVREPRWDTLTARAPPNITHNGKINNCRNIQKAWISSSFPFSWTCS